MKKELGIMKDSDDRYVIREVTGAAGKVDKIFPMEINFKDFNGIFEDDGDWYCELIICGEDDNKFNSTIDIAKYLKNEGIEIVYPPELIEETSVIELDLVMNVFYTSDNKTVITAELISTDDYYNKSYYFYIETPSVILNIGNRGLRNSITENVMKVFKAVYEDPEIKAKFKVRSVSDDSLSEDWSTESMETLVNRINGGLNSLWIQKTED